MKFPARALVFAALLSTSLVAAPSRPATARLDIIASAETHAMVAPCDCPHQPGGGLAQRASALQELRTQGPLLLVDGGGFAAGGVYDIYTEGRAVDSLRTLATINAMAAMNYDAVAVGDDELQYGAAWLAQQALRSCLPLVSANIMMQGKLAFQPYVVVQKGGYRIAITAVTTTEKLFAVDPTLSIAEPHQALQQLWGELEQVSDFQIILSHLGEEESIQLAQHFSGAEVVVNGHRKQSPQPLQQVGAVPLLQFGFQGKALCHATAELSGGAMVLQKAGWNEIHPGLAAHPGVDVLIKQTLSGPSQSRPTYDLYIMSQCPYGLEALGEFSHFIHRAPDVQGELWFIGSLDDQQRLNSLHGVGEVRDEMAWLGFKELYFSRWHDFLSARAKSSEASFVLMARLGADTAALARWVELKGDSALAFHYRRSQRLGIDASPTLLRNNTPVEFALSADRLSAAECASRSNKPAYCDSLPQCFEDRDCRQPGKVGRCLSDGSKARCEYSPAVAFDFVILTADSMAGPDEQGALATTAELFPGAAVQRVLHTSAQGQQLIGELKPTVLPMYLFGQEVRQAVNFDKVETGLIEAGRFLTFKPGIMRPSLYLNRRVDKGRVEVFIDPVFAQAPQAVGMVSAAMHQNPRIVLAALLTQQPGSSPATFEQRAREEEAARWLVLATLKPALAQRYLQGFMNAGVSTQWHSWVGRDAPEVLKKATAAQQQLPALWREIEALGLREPVSILIDNTRLVPIRDVDALQGVLNAP
jgi:hypothetical protein